MSTGVQFDEKWTFLVRKEAKGDRDDPDDDKDDRWDHVPLDLARRLLVAVAPGPGRTRTPGRLSNSSASGPGGG
jgi:hypothetical protein